MRRRKNFLTRRHTMSFETLKASIRAHGQFTPVFRLGGVIIDGRRRDRAMKELGRTPRTVDLKSKEEATRVLWVHHPFQALQEYASETDSIATMAEQMGASIAELSQVLAANRPPPPPKGRAVRYRAKYDRLRRYLGRVRQGLEPITVNGVEHAISDATSRQR